ncbi:glycosyltransferase involved in cell wall biosynthesis [Pedobacter sp. AK017]|uniref:glycosyltransferase family 4 protein n=1 Tax=Pedobacter sp. AK017 TaxID=2723073 RepID=UPI00160EFA04|nr:glycosyltransferase family 4 protein [Pedobacter sp. AK017]MBB5436377.1 glycosyltransferase involved in cell wall biosynthesis [Pedobacter sp. AK017]
MNTTKKIKILQTIRQGKIGGGESHVIDLVEELNKDRYESIVLSFTEGPMVDRMKAKGIKTYVIETETPFDFTKWGAVHAILEKEKIDIVHAHGTRANSNTFSSANKLGIPVLYTVHGWSFHPDQKFLLRNFRILGEKYLVNKSRLTICVSDNNLNDAKKLFPMKRATVVKYGINLNKFNPDADFSDLRAELGLSKDTFVIGYVVRMTIQKDPLTLVRAIAMMPEDLDIKFLFVGDGDLKNDAVKLAKELNVTDRIIFMDFRQDVPNVLNAINVYCLPSLWEGLPIGMLEAMAMEKAVVVTAIDGAREVIVNEENGLLIPPQNPKKLAEALLQLYHDRHLTQRISKAAGQTIQENFNVVKMTRSIECIYDSTLER